MQLSALTVSRVPAGLRWYELPERLGERLWSLGLTKGSLRDVDGGEVVCVATIEKANAPGLTPAHAPAGATPKPSGMGRPAPKYIKRVAKPGGGYRYYYAAHEGGGVHNAEHFTAGSSFAHEGGHFHVKGVGPDGMLDVEHSHAPGQRVQMTKDELAGKIKEHHGEALETHRKAVLERFMRDIGQAAGKRKEALEKKASKYGYEKPAATPRERDRIALPNGKTAPLSEAGKRGYRPEEVAATRAAVDSARAKAPAKSEPGEREKARVALPGGGTAGVSEAEKHGYSAQEAADLREAAKSAIPDSVKANIDSQAQKLRRLNERLGEARNMGTRHEAELWSQQKASRDALLGWFDNLKNKAPTPEAKAEVERLTKDIRDEVSPEAREYAQTGSTVNAREAALIKEREGEIKRASEIRAKADAEAASQKQAKESEAKKQADKAAADKAAEPLSWHSFSDAERKRLRPEESKRLFDLHEASNRWDGVERGLSSSDPKHDEKRAAIDNARKQIQDEFSKLKAATESRARPRKAAEGKAPATKPTAKPEPDYDWSGGAPDGGEKKPAKASLPASKKPPESRVEHALKSSNLERVSWDPDKPGSAKGTMRVHFKGGNVGEYAGVHHDDYRKVVDSPQSHGQAFNEHIKDLHPYTELRGRDTGAKRKENLAAQSAERAATKTAQRKETVRKYEEGQAKAEPEGPTPAALRERYESAMKRGDNGMALAHANMLADRHGDKTALTDYNRKADIDLASKDFERTLGRLSLGNRATESERAQAAIKQMRDAGADTSSHEKRLADAMASTAPKQGDNSDEKRAERAGKLYSRIESLPLMERNHLERHLGFDPTMGKESGEDVHAHKLLDSAAAHRRMTNTERKQQDALISRVQSALDSGAHKASAKGASQSLPPEDDGFSGISDAGPASPPKTAAQRAEDDKRQADMLEKQAEGYTREAPNRPPAERKQIEQHAEKMRAEAARLRGGEAKSAPVKPEPAKPEPAKEAPAKPANTKAESARKPASKMTEDEREAHHQKMTTELERARNAVKVARRTRDQDKVMAATDRLRRAERDHMAWSDEVSDARDAEKDPDAFEHNSIDSYRKENPGEKHPKVGRTVVHEAQDEHFQHPREHHYEGRTGLAESEIVAHDPENHTVRLRTESGNEHTVDMRHLKNAVIEKSPAEIEAEGRQQGMFMPHGPPRDEPARARSKPEALTPGKPSPGDPYEHAQRVYGLSDKEMQTVKRLSGDRVRTAQDKGAHEAAAGHVKDAIVQLIGSAQNKSPSQVTKWMREREKKHIGKAGMAMSADDNHRAGVALGKILGYIAKAMGPLTEAQHQQRVSAARASAAHRHGTGSGSGSDKIQPASPPSGRMMPKDWWKPKPATTMASLPSDSSDAYAHLSPEEMHSKADDLERRAARHESEARYRIGDERTTLEDSAADMRASAKRLRERAKAGAR